MKNMTFKRSKLGFTLAELLLVIAILAILAGLGVTGFVALRQNIIIAKYDDLAREIYVAAQNQLTRLEANGMDQNTLNALQMGSAIPSQPLDYTADDWDDVEDNFRYAAKGHTQPMTVLLPLGSVADDVRTNGCYVIEYNVQTRTVYGVFYSAENFDYTDVTKAADFRTSRSARKEYMVGYYGGSAVERDPLTHCEVPKLEIINNNELRLNILEVPEGVEISVQITDSEGKSMDATPDAVNGDVNKMTVLLDSMNTGGHFHELFSELTPGKDLTVTVTYAKAGAISSSASVTANSLFATRETGTDGDTVTLAWARHLQNLEDSVSRLDYSDIAIARQTEHIQWEDDFGTFVSISNDGKNGNLKRFEGNNLEIRDLKGSNGLFAQTKEGMVLSGIRIVNPAITADPTGASPVGALVGTAASGTQIYWCGVYANRVVNNQISYNDYGDCYVKGGSAITGGLVGQATGTVVKYSFAALPTLSGSSGASLIGSAANCTIDNSYANCDNLQPGFNYFVSGEGNKITHCYAVGNVESAQKSAFCGTNDTVDTVTDSYYAVSHREFADAWADNKDLAATEFCYIGTAGWVTTDQEQIQNAVGSGWENMIAPLSHPYREYLDGRAFPYPAIGELDHYGSWPDSDGTVNLKIDMTLLNNESAGYAIFAGQVIVQDEAGQVLFDSDKHKNPDGSFDGLDTIPVSPGTKVTITITPADGYEYLYTVVDSTRYSDTVEYTVNRDTVADITFQQKAFVLTGEPAVNAQNNRILSSSYSIDLTSPMKTLTITSEVQSERKVETGSTVTVRPKVPGGYSGSVVWYDTDQANRTYVTPDADNNYTFTMPAGNTVVHVMYTVQVVSFEIEYYLMDTLGNYPKAPTQTASYNCGLGSQINQSMINALAESSGLLLTIDTERVRYLEHALVLSEERTTVTVFESSLDSDGKVISAHDPFVTNIETTYNVKIYIARKEYSVTLTADTNVSGVRFGDTGDFQTTVTQTFRYGATVTAQADVALGYRFAYWDPQDSRFMMSADSEYTFQVPQFDLNLKATAATDRYLVTVNLLENDESWLYSDSSRQADPITLTLVNSEDDSKTYPMQVLTEDTVSYAMQAAVPAVPDYGAGYYIRVNYASGLRSWIYTSGTQDGTDEQNGRLLLYVRDKAVEATAKFYSVTYYPSKQLYSGTVPQEGSYPMYYHLTMPGNTGLLRNLTDNDTIFSGWMDYYAQGTGSYTGGETLMITRRVDMFAQWQPSMQVVYDGNGADGGELPVDAKTYQENEQVTVKFGSLTRKGYRFLGWSTDQDATAPIYTETGTKEFTIKSENITLYAVWAQEEYTVQFYDTNGNPLTSDGFLLIGKHYGDTITAPDLTESTMIGWSLTRGGEIVCRPGEQFTVTGDTKLYACVSAEAVQVTYMSSDGNMLCKTEQFGKGIPGYLTYVPGSGPVTAWSTQPNGQGTLYLCDESGRSEQAYAFTEDITLYAVTGKVYNYNRQLWFDTLCAAVGDDHTLSGDTLIVYRDTTETERIKFEADLYVIANGNRTVKWQKLTNEGTGEFVGCMNVSNSGSAVTVVFGRSDIPTLSMDGSTLTFDANQQSRVISLGKQATFHMYDGITLTNGKRVRTNNPDETSGTATSNLEARSYYGGGVYAGLESVFYMHGGTITNCSAYKGGGVYLFADKNSKTPGSKMYMGDMVTPTAYSATAIYYTKGDDGFYISVTDKVTAENYKNYYVTAGNPEICYNESTRRYEGEWANDDGGGGLMMLDLKDGDLVLYKGSIHNNTAFANGGGIVTDGGATIGGETGDKAKLRIYEVDISHNTAYGYGGGIFQWQGIVYIYNSTIRQNYAQQSGGGIYLHHYDTENSTVEFHYGDIADNKAGKDGGGVYLESAPVKMTITNGNLVRNSAENGGGVYVADSGTFELQGGTVSNNAASKDGGGIYSSGTVTMTGGTLSGNWAGNYGGGIYSGGTMSMSGGTVCNNSGRYLGGGIMVNGKFNLSGGSLYGNTDTDYEINQNDEDNVNPGPNDIYLVGDSVITVPDGGIKLSGEERVAVDCDRDKSLRFPNATIPRQFAVYANASDFNSNDALYFTYYGTRSTQYSTGTRNMPDLTVVSHKGLQGTYAVGLYFAEETADSSNTSYVAFDLNYPDCNNPNPQAYSVGTVLNLNTDGPTTTRPGYYLAGWARTPDALEEEYELFYDVVDNVWKSGFEDGKWKTKAIEPCYTVQDLFSQTLYAMWRPCVVVYNVGESAAAGNVTIQATDIGPYVTILNPSPLQYTVDGKTYYFQYWKDTSSEATYVPMQQVELTENIRLQAVWGERTANSHIITFYFNDGTSDQTGELCRKVEVTAGGSYTIDVDIHQANKILVGWAPNPDGTGTRYATNASISNVEADLDLYAVWAEAVTLTYDANYEGGTGLVVSVKKGEKVTLSHVPTREGYTFLGWAATADATEETYLKDAEFGPMNQNTTLYAVWTENSNAAARAVSPDLPAAVLPEEPVTVPQEAGRTKTEPEKE